MSQFLGRRRSRAVAATVVMAVVVAILGELLLRPVDHTERLHLVAILVVPIVITAAVIPGLRRWVTGRRSVAGAAVLVGVTSLAIGAATASAASAAMFVSSHDYRLFVILLLLSSGLALMVGTALAAPLADDIARLGDVAGRVAAGDLSVRTGIDRRDEVGRTATAIDTMVDALAAAAAEHQRVAAARQMLLSSVGHDLRTPLAAMRAAVESLADGVVTDPARYYTVLGHELASVEALVDQLSAFARVDESLESGQTERVSVTELADEAIEALAHLARDHDVQLRLDSHTSGVVDATVLDVQRIVRNLIDNAIGHSPPHGVVTVTVTHTVDVPGGGAIHLTVADQGSGFPESFRDAAFEPFTRADEARSNPDGHAGLGLAISKALVERHHGRIWIGDGPGGVVHVAFPAADANR